MTPHDDLCSVWNDILLSPSAGDTTSQDKLSYTRHIVQHGLLQRLELQIQKVLPWQSCSCSECSGRLTTLLIYVLRSICDFDGPFPLSSAHSLVLPPTPPSVVVSQMSGATPLSCAMGGAGGPDGECANLLRASGGLVRLVEDTICPGSILDVPLRRPRRAMDDRADALGRMVYTGQF